MEASVKNLSKDRNGGFGLMLLCYRIVKRAFDIVFSLAVLIFFSLLYAVVALAVALDSRGGVIYRRICVGKDGKPFPMFKFRTMRTEPPEEILSPEQYAQWKSEVKVDNDPRITRVGAIIRSVSIDELPQFVNVLRGEMSVIGPRPVTEEEADQYGFYKDELLSVKPGITGYWQAYGREDTDYSENGTRITMQLYYVRNASLRLDAKILIKTVASVVCRTGR